MVGHCPEWSPHKHNKYKYKCTIDQELLDAAAQAPADASHSAGGSTYLCEMTSWSPS